MSYRSGSEEFGTSPYEDSPSRTFNVGDKGELIVSRCDPVVNFYDQLYVTGNDRPKVVWPIAAG